MWLLMPFAATWMDLQIVRLSEVSQRKRNNACMRNLKKKNAVSELIYKTERDS